MPATTTTNAPVGPPIWTARAAERGDQEAGDDGAVDAGLRREAGGDGERHRERQRDEADGDAGDDDRARKNALNSPGEPGSTPEASCEHLGDFGAAQVS